MIPKFRFYSKRMNKIGIVISLHPLRKRVYVEWDDALSGTENIDDNGVLMQSTGLFDNSIPKKEIFEGDVVELHHFTENYSETGGFYEGEESLVGVVRYGYTDDEIKYFGKVYPPRWFIENRYRELVFSDLSGLHEESFKVIGNVYQNKELTEEL